MAWSKNGTTTLSSAGDTVTVSSLTATEFNTNLFHGVSSGNIQHRIQLGYTSLDSGNNYARRYSQNGGADGTGTSETIISSNVSVADIFAVHYSINIGTEEKLFIIFTGEQGTAGAGNVPQRMETVAKWSNTSNQYDVIEINNGNTGDFDTDSNLTVLNGDTTEETILGNNVQSGSRFEATDTRKIYYGASPPTPTTYDWSTDHRTNTFNVNTSYSSFSHTNSKLQLNVSSGTGQSGGSVTYVDLGSALSDKWVMTFEGQQTSLSTTAANNHHVVGMSSVAPTTTGHITSTNWIGIRWYKGNQWGNDANKLGIEPRIGQNTSSGNHNNSTGVNRLYGRPSEGSNANGVFYHKLVWNGITGVFNYYVYNNNNYSGTPLASAELSSTSNTQWVTGTPTSVTGLRYLVIYIGNDHQLGTYTHTFDNFKIYDGATSTDFTWTEEV
jgi:hypothetical protein